MEEEKDACGKVYSAGIYARLSVEGDERKNESIEAQIAIAEAFLETREDIELFDCYVDLGKSGTNFDREGFARLMQDVRDRKVDCVVVKDLSRFGRNHIEMGNYLERIFPFLGVRFIAVADRFDSMGGAGGISMGVSLKNLFNEMYARDISLKVRSAKREMREQGNYVGGVPPYGYRAVREGGRRKLEKDEGAAEVVRRIYEKFLAGDSMEGVRRWLYAQRVNRPQDYRRSGQVRCPVGGCLREWPRATIRAVLENPAYAGFLERDVGSSGGKERAHEAIVPAEAFAEAAARLQRSAREKSGEGTWEESNEPDVQLQRSARKKSGEGAARPCGKERGFQYVGEKIGETELSGLLGEAFWAAFILSSAGREELERKIRRDAGQAAESLKRRILKLGKRLESAQRERSVQYQKYRAGFLPLEAFLAKDKEGRACACAFLRQKEDAEGELEKLERECGRKLDALRGLFGSRGEILPSEEALRCLVACVEARPGRRVRIELSFRREG